MNKRETERFLERQVIPRLPGFVIADRMVLRAPVGLVACFVLFDASGSNRHGFGHVYATVMPLWRPTEHLWLNHSIDLQLCPWPDDEPLPDPVPGFSRFAYVEQIQRFALPMFAQLGTPEGLYRNLRDHDRRQANSVGIDSAPWVACTEETLIGASVIMNDLAGAINNARRLIDVFKRNTEPYARTKVAQLSELLDRLALGRDAAMDLLKQWEAFTLGHLKLDQYLDPDRWDRYVAPPADSL